MNSLVAYEDSESDTEEPEDGPSPSTPPATEHGLTSGTANDVAPSSLCCGTAAVGVARNLYPIGPHSRPTAVPSFTRTGDAFSKSEVNFINCPPNPQKRPPGGETVRLYIPKRLRQEQSEVPKEVKCDVEEKSHDHTVQSARSIFKVSNYLGPYLPEKYKETGIPRNVVFQMQEHSGPVNRVQWCPVKQFSHLLLSASMDSTVKVWDGVDSGRCLRTIHSHRMAVRDAQWSLCGQKILSGGFDSILHLTDVETGKDLFNAKNDWKIGVVRFHPIDPNLFICGGFSPAIKAWDVRASKVIHVYRASVQQHFDVLFLRDGKEFLSTTDSVSRDSADRTIIAWDFGTAAKISNQIFHERYTCPSLALHPTESAFVAQTNGDYIALFSAQRPYKMNKRKRYEGHKVEGFAVGCEFSPDGSLIVTGSSEGAVYFYNYHTSKIIRSLPGDGNACVTVNYHPVLTSLLATAYWDGQIRVWQ
ncbi:WD repeat-containing protein 25 [Hyperolius riggenbachi]|uniref:WD repeat-containing protein 25 n=1 Tax=Hyperolius riggenbachi TaxID=752182 RepID=UPI0035A3A9A8